MKKRIYLITTLLLSAAVLTMSSCLKDPRAQDFSNVGTLVELPLEAYNGLNALIPEALPILTTPQTIPVVVNIASPKPLSTAITVTLAIDQAALTAYNHANGLDTGGNTPYTLLPANTYTISSLTVTIPAGQRTGTVNVMVNTSLVDPSGAFVLPLSITDGGGQKISNYKTVLLNVQAKNKYDGTYTVDGSMVDVVNPAIVGKYPVDYYLETMTANSDVMFDFNYASSFYHEITSGGATNVYGNFAPVFTFDASGNITSVVDYYGQGTNSSGRSAVLDPTGVNKYTTGTPGAAGSVFKVKYIMIQAGSPRTTFDETWTYKGSRP
jgi:hypothetical protein